jgi:hypothetical protein
MESEEVVEQVTFELPEFEGQVPVGVLTRINGTGQRVTRPLRIGERGVAVVEYEVLGVNHVEDKAGLKRIQTLGVKDLYDVEGKEAKKLLANMRTRFKTAEDERLGRRSLPGIDSELHTDHGQVLDENGVALTTDEVAAIRGDDSGPTTLMDGPDPVVLVFSDGSRALWPGDYDVPGSEPFAGDFLVNPNNASADELQILKVLDTETGEELESWGDADEELRLKKLEMEAMAQEAEEAEVAKPKKKKASKKKSATETAVPALPGEDE